MTAPVWGQRYKARRSDSVVAHGLDELSKGGSMRNAMGGAILGRSGADMVKDQGTFLECLDG